MSTSNQKAALFGKGKADGASSSSSSTSSATTPTPAAPKLATVGTGIINTAISATLRKNKTEEAKDWLDKAATSLKTSFFQWNPDYLSAASCYEKASDAYKVIEEYQKAREAMVNSADSNEKAGCMTAAAFTYGKVAQLCQLQKQPQSAAEYFWQAAELHGLNGEIDKMAEMLSKSAKEWEAADKSKAASTYRQACDRIFPPSTQHSSISQIHPKALDIFRDAFLFHIRERLFPGALYIARRACLIYEAYDSEVTLCKMFVSITLVQLANGAVCEADQTFLQEHLNNSHYIRSKECALAELFINAFKSREIEDLDAAKRCVDLNYLDKDIQNLAKKLSVVSGPNDWPIPVEQDAVGSKESKGKAPSGAGNVSAVFKIPPAVVQEQTISKPAAALAPPPAPNAAVEEVGHAVDSLALNDERNTDVIAEEHLMGAGEDEDEVDIC